MGSTANSGKDDSEDTCVICLSSVTERAITAPCNHYTFDFVCLVSWLQERSTCPLCKSQVTAVQYDWRSPNDYKSYSVPQEQRSKSVVRERQHSSLFASYGLPARSRGLRRSYSPPVEDAALSRRREVYSKRLYSLHVGSNPFSGYRDITPEVFAQSPELQSRARTWIRRELRVFAFLHSDTTGSLCSESMTSSNAEFLLSYIVSILKMVDIQASNGHAENLLTEFLGRESSRQFLHELLAWLRSPFARVSEWDEEVQYREEIE